MIKTEFKIKGMDCPSEEQLIRMKLEGVEGIRKLSFDIPNRKLEIYHDLDNARLMHHRLTELKLGASLVGSGLHNAKIENEKNTRERRILWWVLGINFGFFIIEITTGFISNSMGLVADSLDMLADSLVYALSLMVVGSTVVRKKWVAMISGYFQIVLALLGFAEVIRRYLDVDVIPDYRMMILISVFALLGNALCLYLLNKARSEDAHMQASWIFTSNDILVNLGVIAAAVLIIFTESNLPDLIIGALVFGLVLRGAIRILKLAR
jgi:Co/Zn/Cd efflux system component